MGCSESLLQLETTPRPLPLGGGVVCGQTDRDISIGRCLCSEASGLEEHSRGWSESSSDTLGRRGITIERGFLRHPNGVREFAIAR